MVFIIIAGLDGPEIMGEKNSVVQWSQVCIVYCIICGIVFMFVIAVGRCV